MSDTTTAPTTAPAASAPESRPATHIALPVELANGILGYLAQRPYGEVADLIKGMETTSVGVAP
ncbi:hypothetical protein ABAZ39_28950 (plasmid) [Azospirillum argentinense]|uniref:Uncharacterized protein n=2 Tax=Azospirillum TaxID=191 RepID=A0A2K1G4P7_9PROT|nr:hypothetical protein [Azospirillum argentinense]AIB15887.1 hypothetical protein ABAZ39_28950 [Azospirillum argentinense]EZQ03716.1 hypothetical protein ABAZ39_27815 [Azospirillum argentinense]MBK3801510.1 hypothetical protein [Azospirillum argentinense]PNQ99764.1 hypothetical protein C1S70_05150 [Azospirillum argentinense]QCO06358.1 hypothetical protein D3867_31105 [Azospirillum argentinense]